MKVLRICFFLLVIQAPTFGQVVINEICASNGDLRYDPDYFDFPPFVELYNAGGSSANVSNFYLSDDATQRGKWRIPSGTSIPSKGHLIIWCDSRNSRMHTNFNLDSDGEEIIFSNSSQTEIDKITFGKQYINVTYGRLSDGENTIGFMVNPTPGGKNNPLSGDLLLENPTLSLKSGRYQSSQSLNMSAFEAGATVRYTTDGSEPNSGSTAFTSSIQITKTTTVKAKTFKEGYLPSKTEVKTFFINQHTFTLPVVSVSGKPSYFFDNTIGIIVDGTNGIDGNCTGSRVNWNQDWDRHAVFEYYEKTGEKILDQHVDVRVGGGCSRNNAQKSLVVRARDKYGEKTIEHEFFKTKAINDFGGLMLRNCGNDFYSALIRDGLMQSLTVGQMDLDYLAYQPAIVYLNGDYWGIQTIREKVDGDYVESNFGIDKNDVDIIETYGNAIEGTSARYQMYLDSLQKIDLSSPEAYEFINRYIDAQELINYFTAEIYYGNTDWPGNNIKFWRQRSTNGKFRWVLWDLDFGMALYQDASYATHPTLNFATDPADPDGWPNPPWSTLHLRLLLQIPEFRNKMIQTLTTSLTSTFKPQRVISMINDFQDEIRPEMPFHVARWNLNMDNWNWEVERLRLFAQERNDFMKTHIADFFGLDGEVRFNLATFPANAGSVQLNGITTSSLTDAFYYKNIPFDLVAQPSPGYAFSHYKIRKQEATKIALIDKGTTWKYNDAGSLPAPDWISSSYSDNGWAEGAAELGYGDLDEVTQVGYGGVDNNKFVTTYFRKTFTVADTVGLAALSGSVLFDDGVVVYLNGEEVYRGNMPVGAIGNSTLASNQNSETVFFPFVIPKGKVKPGENVVAVEVHQSGITSSDISFNLELSSVKSGAETEYIVEEMNVSDLASSDVSIEAYFVPVTPSTGLVINEFSADNTTLEDSYGEKDDWIEIYNNGSQAVDIANYFVTDDLGTKLKHRIPQGKSNETIIEPGAYKILWADDDVQQGPLHLSFKLSADGEELGLFQMVGSLIEKSDDVVFEKQILNAAFARIPNVTGDFVQTIMPTPMAENIFEVPVAIEESESPIQIYPNPGDGTFRINSPKRITRVEIFSSTGNRIKTIIEFDPESTITLDDAPSGMYLFKLESDGKAVFKRVIKR